MFSGTKRVLRNNFYDFVPPVVSQRILPILPPSSPFHSSVLNAEIIFIHVPKTAGTSIKQKLYQTSDRLGHRRICEYYAFDPHRASMFFKFAVVRNPWDRFYSAYCFLNQRQNTSHSDRVFSETILGKFDGFEAFVDALQDRSMRRKVLSYTHFIPQSYWICRRGASGHALDYLGRFENLSADLERVFDRIGRHQAQLPQVRASRHGAYREAYSPRSRNIVADLYLQDITLLGYDF